MLFSNVGAIPILALLFNSSRMAIRRSIESRSKATAWTMVLRIDTSYPGLICRLASDTKWTRRDVFLGETPPNLRLPFVLESPDWLPADPTRLGYLSVKPAEVIRGSWAATRLNGTAHICGKLLGARILLSRDGSSDFALGEIADAIVDHREHENRRVCRFRSSDRNSSVTTQRIAPATG